MAWFTHTYLRSTLAAIRENIPDFERRSFGLAQPDLPVSSINERLDIMVRKPFRNDPHYIPIGLVSKEYQLVPHKEVLGAAIAACEKSKIALAEAQVDLTLTQYGERMGLRVFLPKQYDFDPGDGHPMAMRLECFNSVEGSLRFKVFIGWFRFVCSNGLIIGVTRTNFQHRHDGDLSIADIATVLTSGLKEADKEKKRFEAWQARIIDQGHLVRWIEKHVSKTWGFKAATRAYHVARSGYDVEIAGSYKDTSPTTIPVKATMPSGCLSMVLAAGFVALGLALVMLQAMAFFLN
jgi:hypothetical protein